MHLQKIFYSNVCWLLPLLFGIACWLCVSAVLYFIFCPAKKKNILGIKVQGILPARFLIIKKNIADKLTELILSKKQDLQNTVASEDSAEKIMPEIENHIHTFLTEKLPKEMPMIAMFLGEKTTNQIKEVFVKELKILFPKVLSQYMDKLFTKEKLQQTLSDYFASVSEAEIIASLKKSGSAVFGRIKLFAFVFGIVAGNLLMFVLNLFT